MEVKNTVKKAVLVIAIALLAAAMLATPVMATKPTHISGRWVGVPGTQVLTNPRHAGGNTFGDVYNKGTYVAGDILGSFEQNWAVVVHYRDPRIVESLNSIPPNQWPEAPFNWNHMDRVFTGTVLGVSGSFTMRLQAKGYGNTMKGLSYWDLEGTWVIISGTGGLSGLHGQGTWWHSRTGFAGLEYEGQVHFDP